MPLCTLWVRLCHLYQVFVLIGKISPGLLCWKLNSCSSLSLSLSVRLQAFNHLHSPSLDLLQYVHAFLRAQNWTKHSQCVSPALRVRERSPPLICWHVAFFTTGTLLVHSQVVHQDPQVLFHRTHFQPVALQFLPVHWLYFSGSWLSTSIY